MPIMFGNVNNNDFDNNSNNTNTYSNNFFIKEEARRLWYVYRATPGGVVKPYPVFDSQGNSCPVLTGNFESQFSHMPDAFAIVPMASYSGMDGKLSFIDYCTDMHSFVPEGRDRVPTPYSFLVNGLFAMLPDPKTMTTRSGLPTPNRLRTMKRSYISRSKLSIVFRGCMLKHKNGAPSTAKNAVGGMFFNCIYIITPKSAVNSFASQFLVRREPEMDLSADNTIVKNIFNINGAAFRFSKTGTSESDDYVVSVEFERDYAKNAMTAFNLSNENDYFRAIRESYGHYQTMESLLHVMSTSEMIDLLKQNYPISWLWYGLKDSPYASFFSQNEKNQAYADPEMTPWFGLSEPNNNNSNNAHQASGYNSTPQQTVNYQPATPVYNNTTTNNAAPQNPYANTYNNTPAEVKQAEVNYVPEGASYTEATANRMSNFEQLYGNKNSFNGVNKTDEIQY